MTVWGNPPTVLNIVLFVLAVIAVTIIFTWFLNHTRSSVFMAMLLHGSNNAFWINLVPALFPVHLVTGYGSNVPTLIGYGWWRWQSSSSREGG